MLGDMQVNRKQHPCSGQYLRKSLLISMEDDQRI